VFVAAVGLEAGDVEAGGYSDGVDVVLEEGGYDSVVESSDAVVGRFVGMDLLSLALDYCRCGRRIDSCG